MVNDMGPHMKEGKLKVKKKRRGAVGRTPESIRAL